MPSWLKVGRSSLVSSDCDFLGYFSDKGENLIDSNVTLLRPIGADVRTVMHSDGVGAGCLPFVLEHLKHSLGFVLERLEPCEPEIGRHLSTCAKRTVLLKQS